MTTTITTTAPALLAALRAVRFAAGSDPSLPAINGVLLDAATDGVRLVATDRYRLAVAPVEGARFEGPASAALLPTGWVDEVLPQLAEAADAVLAVGADEVTLHLGADVHTVAPLRYDYPDYRRLLPAGRAGVPVEPAALRAAIEAAPVLQRPGGRDGGLTGVALLEKGDDGVVVVAEPGDARVAFDREFLLEAVTTAGDGPLTLALDGTLEPLVIRTPDGGVSMLMPFAMH